MSSVEAASVVPAFVAAGRFAGVFDAAVAFDAVVRAAGVFAPPVDAPVVRLVTRLAGAGSGAGVEALWGVEASSGVVASSGVG